jgi:hypothetical protein
VRSRQLGTLVAMLVVALLAISLGPLHTARADDNQSQPQAIPETFVGTANQCAPYPAGSRIVTSAWLNGFGLPDNGGQNGVPSTARDPHSGLLLSKNGPTADCSAAGARITGGSDMKITATFELGFDFRNGSHCGAGAPRFNVTTSDGHIFFFGCADGTQSPAPQDPAQWTRVRFTAAQAAPQTAANPPFASETGIRSIEIIFDEGTDTPSVQDPNGVGLVSLDNIDINGKLITHGPQGNGNGNNGNSGDNGNGNGNGD